MDLNRAARRLAPAAIIANFLPVALLFYFVHCYGVDVPFHDEWNGFVRPLERFNRGTLGWFDLFGQHVEHRPFFPRLLTLANATLFHWDRKVEMYATVILLILCARLLFRFVRTYWVHPLTPFLFLPMVWELLSWRQWQNILFAFQTCYGLLAAGVAGAFCLLHRARTADRFVTGAAAAAFVASYSAGGGLLIWPIGFAQLLLQRWRAAHDGKPGNGAFLVWIGAGTLTWVSYFATFHSYPWSYPTGPAYLLHNPLLTARYVVTAVGSPLSIYQPIAQSLGFIMMALGVWGVVSLLMGKTSELVAAAPLLALMAFTLITVVAACNYRMGDEGIKQALASRYCTVTMLGLVALYALLTRLALTGRTLTAWLALGSMTSFLMLGIITSYLSWRLDSDCLWMLHLDTIGTYMLRYPDLVSDEGLKHLNPKPYIVREGIPFLKAHRYTLFHHEVPYGVPGRDYGSTPGCNIETVNRQPSAAVSIGLQKDSLGVKVEGWAVDLSAEQVPTRLFVSIDGQIDIPAVPDGERPDVVGSLKNRNYRNAGFVSFVRTSLFTVGDHTLEMKIVNRDGTGYWTCGTARLRVTQ